MNTELSDLSKLAEIVKTERKAQNVTQVQLSQLGNVGIRFIRDIERGKTSLQFDKLMRVLDTLGIAVTLSTPAAGE